MSETEPQAHTTDNRPHPGGSSADATLGGQQPFIVEKGEQIHSPEQARAIAAEPFGGLRRGADVVHAHVRQPARRRAGGRMWRRKLRAAAPP